MSKEFDKLKFGKQKRDRKGAWITCSTCKREFYVFPARLKLGMVKYCSSKCFKRDGDKNPMWNHKQKKSSIDKMMNHPNRYSFKDDNSNPNIRYSSNNYTGNTYSWWQKHRNRRTIICERCGFKETGILQVHHKDRNRKNNKKENIEIICPNCHTLEHFNNKDGQFHNK